MQKRLSPPYVCDTRLLFETKHDLTWCSGLLYSQVRTLCLFVFPNSSPVSRIPLFLIQMASESHVA